MKKWLETDNFEEAFDKFNDNADEIDNTFELKADKATTYTKTEVDNSLDLKANKQQEEWMTPTLLNGWTTPTKIEYYKDNFGVVRISGRVSDGGNATGVIFQLPVGYRPIITRQFPVMASDKFAGFMIEPNGNGRWISGSSKVNVNLDVITFKAEQ